MAVNARPHSSVRAAGEFRSVIAKLLHFVVGLSCLVFLTMLTITLLTKEAGSVMAQQENVNTEMSLHSDNGAPRGIWSDGTTMWVTDFSDRKIYALSLIHI